MSIFWACVYNDISQDPKISMDRIVSLIRDRKFAQAFELSQEWLASIGETWLSAHKNPDLDLFVQWWCVGMHFLPTSESFKIGSLYAEHCFLTGRRDISDLYFYRQPITTKKSVRLPNLCDKVGFDPNEWWDCNPSCCPKNSPADGFWCVQRLVNFTSNRATDYKSHSKDGKFSTRNLLLDLDADLNLLGWVEIIDRSDRTIYPKHVQGLEDIQIFLVRSEAYIFCTLVDCQPSGVPQMGYGKLDLKTGHVTNLVTLRSENPNRCEKNWLPYTDADKLYVWYSGHNSTRLEISATGGLISKSSKSPHVALREVRGSGGPIPYRYAGKQGWLVLYHEVIWIKGGRTYIHRFAFMNTDLVPVAVSKSFTFNNTDIEFARSMCCSGDSVLIGAGVNDHESWLFLIDTQTIDSMLVF